MYFKRYTNLVNNDHHIVALMTKAGCTAFFIMKYVCFKKPRLDYRLHIAHILQTNELSLHLYYIRVVMDSKVTVAWN